MPLRTMAVVVTAASLAPAIASAQTRPGMPTAQTEPYSAYELIASGRSARAEASLLRQARLHPDAPEVMLNLAALRLTSGRVAEAADLYSRVIALPPMDMDMPDGSIRSSHAVARTGIARIRT